MYGLNNNKNAGKKTKSLSQIELGNNFVSAENLEAICIALDTLPKNLFDFSQQSQQSTEINLEYISNKLKQNKSLAEKVYKFLEIIE